MFLEIKVSSFKIQKSFLCLMFDLAKKSSKSQIKGKLALQDVSKVISFIGEKFDAYEQERSENEKKLKN